MKESLDKCMNDTLSHGDLQLALELVMHFGWNATSYQIVNPGIKLWFSKGEDAVIGHVSYSRTRVVAGAPVCENHRLMDVVREFEDEASGHGQRVIYFGAEQRLADVLSEEGKRGCIALGAQPAWNPQNWPAMLAAHASLRQQLNRARNKGVLVDYWDNATATDHPELQRILGEWLTSRGLPPLHFLVEPQTLSRLFNRLVFVATMDGTPVAFLVASPVALRNGWLIEQIVRGTRAPNGTAELMLDQAQRHMAALGASYITLGLSPISRRAGLPDRFTPLWLRILLRAVRAWGTRFYNFEGLDAFKSKFQPERWEAVYAITNGPRFAIGSLYSTSRAFAGGAPVRFFLQARMRKSL